MSTPTEAAQHPSRPHDAEGMRSQRDHWLGQVDFDKAPFTIAWELTRACAYACKHCRADAQHKPAPGELTTEEAFKTIDELAKFEPSPILILTGGDPLMRRDVFKIASYADAAGLRVSMTPTATALTTRERMEQAREAGIRRVAFSLDAPTAEVHDSFRGFSGSFERTLVGMKNARDAGMPLQVNTTVYAKNADLLEDMIPMLEEWGVVQWSVFFLVPTGRGSELEMLTAEGHERFMNMLYDLVQRAPFDVKATAAPHYRRIAMQRAAESVASGSGEKLVPVAGTGAGYSFADGLDRPAKGVNDGRGFMFISHTGEVMPSGFLPIAAGNVREQSPVDIYRDSELFRTLRDPEKLKGKCARCEYREMCGGSRARAYAITGDYMASDPSCIYEPAA